MKRTTLPTFSDNVLNFTLPQSWSELSQEQLRYIFFLLVNFDSMQVLIYAFTRFCGIKVVQQTQKGWHCSTKLHDETIRFELTNEQILSFIERLKYLESYPDQPVHLERLGEYTACDVQLHGISFGDYLCIENLYQGYLMNEDSKALLEIARMLYRDEQGHKARRLNLTDVEQFSVFFWYSTLKNLFARMWSNFFGSSQGDDINSEPPNMLDIMNAQIRALSGGDITKEKEILAMDCWRALTELNEKAREAKEFNQRSNGRN